MVDGEPIPAVTPRESEGGDRIERVVASSLIGVAFVFALVGQSLVFSFSTFMHGDAEYHRGVAFTIASGRLAGEGPLRGLMSYFGGLYPTVLGFGAQALDVSFDALLSVVSWPATLALPFALLYLGRSIWPTRRLEPAFLVFVGTVGSSLGLSPSAEWVFSSLPSGANIWPLYPRDVVLVLSIVAIGLVLRRISVGRVAAAGLLCGTSIAIQSQLGAYATVVVALLVVTATRRARGPARAIGLAVVASVTAAIASAWWWLPRVLEVQHSGQLLLGSYPGLEPPDSSPAGVLNALGLTGILGFVGAVLISRGGVRRERVFAWWLALVLPAALLGNQLRDVGVLTERRIWFLAAIPLVVCAATAAARVARRTSVPAVAAVGALLLLVPSTFEVIHTRDIVQQAWAEPPAHDEFGSRAWSDAIAQLRRRTREQGGLTVLAPDLDALFVWHQSGAQPFSLWLNGPTKLGFDPADVTPWGMAQRLRMQNAAFASGLDGLCRLARRADAADLVLRHDGQLLGVHDLRPASRYRVPPERRTRATVHRKLTPTMTYLDQNSTEFLVVNPRQRIPLGFASPLVRRVQVDTIFPTGDDEPFVIVLPSGAILRSTPNRTHRSFEFSTPNGIPRGSVLATRHSAALLRVIGYRRSPVPLPAGRGVVDLPVTRVCPG